MKNKIKEKELISDKEWNQFLKEEYSQVLYYLPTKESTEKFLNWRKNNASKRKNKTT
jgi:hypothetical protein